MPGQAWLRIALPTVAFSISAGPETRPHRHKFHAVSLGFPQFTRFASESYPSVPPLILMSPLLCR